MQVYLITVFLHASFSEVDSYITCPEHSSYGMYCVCALHVFISCQSIFVYMCNCM